MTLNECAGCANLEHRYVPQYESMYYCCKARGGKIIPSVCYCPDKTEEKVIENTKIDSTK